MKKFLLPLLMSFGLCQMVNAAPGDTTIVQAHPQTSFLSYGNFDHPVVFPSSANSFRKVNMVFTLGKETCPAGTQYCAQWDYTVRISVMTPTDTFELGRFITPYAHSSYPNMPLSWKHDYVFDVTDFYPLLQGNAEMRIKYEGYSYGFTGSLKFEFVEGTPPREVAGIQKMWNKSFAYGQTANPINTNTAPIAFTKPTGTIYAEAYHIISGHGSDDQTNNCAEFCNKWYRWMVDGNNVEQRNIWRNDCGVNWVYPQSGTWVYNRANWCPGDIVFPIVHKVPAASLTNTTFNAGLEFQSYTSSNQSNPPSYTTSNTMFFYKEFSHTEDLGIEDIVAPSKKDLYFRSNPICSDVKLKVKNYGKNTITSVEFEYGIDGQTPETFTWTGSLAAMESAIISLPTLPAFKTITGNNNGFKAIVKKVNGITDQESHNDTAKSIFVAPPKWDKGNFIITMKSSARTRSGYASKWIIRNEAGTIVDQRSSSSPNVTNVDTVHLENGCYSLEVIAEEGMGFSFLNSYTPGSISVTKVTGGAFALPKNNPGNANLAGDFGSGFIQEFVVVESEPLSLRKINDKINMAVVPNPANNLITVKLDGAYDLSGKIAINNVLGQTVLTTNVKGAETKIDIQNLPIGIYTLVYDSNGGTKVEKIVISR